MTEADQNMDGSSLQERLAQLIRKDPRYQPEAYHFVFEALDYTVRSKYRDDPQGEIDDEDPSGTQSRHVTGQDLLEGIREFALEVFGCLAATVFESWGVHRGEDFGEIVFNLVDHGLMGKRDSDTKADFAGGFEGRPFHEVFQVRPRLDYCPEKDEWKATYESVAFG